MRKSKFSEGQIIGFLMQAEAGMAVVEICRNDSFLDATFYKRRSKFGGMEASDAGCWTKLPDSGATGLPSAQTTGQSSRARAFIDWAQSHGIRHILIEPGRPM